VISKCNYNKKMVKDILVIFGHLLSPKSTFYLILIENIMRVASDKSNNFTMIFCCTHFFAMVYCNSGAFTIVLSKINGI
jgi:hypothetical protein